MNSEFCFSTRLKELMSAVETSNSKLAKALNVDASLIYKWLHNKTIPPCNSPYIDLISKYITKNIINSHQFNIIRNLAKVYLPCCEEITESNILDSVKKMLLESQGYSIKMRKAITNNVSKKCQKPLFIKSHANSNIINTININELIGNNIFSNVQVISGHKEVLIAAIDLLNEANRAKPEINDPILMTITSDVYKPAYYPELSFSWKVLLDDVLEKGWNITYLIKTNNNNIRNLKIINDMLIAISTGRCQIYYNNNTEFNPPLEIILVPKSGVLLFLSSFDNYQFDIAFLVKDSAAINTFKEYFYQISASAKPLLRSSNPLESVESQIEYSEAETALGNKFCINLGLTTITIPLSLYENYLQRSTISNEERTKKILCHKSRIKSFEAQVKQYKFRDIIAYEALDNLVNKCEYSLYDKYYISSDITFSKNDAITHLLNIIQLLKSYENFEIGLVSKEQIKTLPITNWMVKENSAVVLFTFLLDSADIHESTDNVKTARGFTITEPNIVKSFESYFNNLWNSIEPLKKDKNEVIKLLELKIKKAQAELK